MRLYLNKDYADGHVIPVVRKHELTLEHKPSFSIHCPDAELPFVLQTVEHLNKYSSGPVDIVDVTKAFADDFLLKNPGWIKVKTSDDVIQDAVKLSKLEGRNFSSLRNALKHIREDLKPEVQMLSIDNFEDALRVFHEWKDFNKTKYFRVTIGRDLRLIKEYYNKLDFVNLFGYVYYVNNYPAGVSFGCRSFKDSKFGMDVTCKGLNFKFKGMGDFAFIHLMQEMHKQGIELVNDSGGTGNVRKNKDKFHPLYTTPMFDLKQK
jgi:hypothetical protein